MFRKPDESSGFPSLPRLSTGGSEGTLCELENHHLEVRKINNKWSIFNVALYQIGTLKPWVVTRDIRNDKRAVINPMNIKQ